MKPAYIILIIIFIAVLVQNRNKTVWLKQFIKSKKTEDKTEMLELAKRFIDKECLIYTFNSQITGTIKEVSDGAILIENGGSVEAVNADYIVRIREYPKNKKGKKKSVVLD